jgi:hypothetical protein
VSAEIIVGVDVEVAVCVSTHFARRSVRAARAMVAASTGPRNLPSCGPVSRRDSQCLLLGRPGGPCEQAYVELLLRGPKPAMSRLVESCQ